MPLKQDAHALAASLKEVMRSLDEHARGDSSSYAGQLARRLRPLVAEYDEAVLVSRSRAQAAHVLPRLAADMGTLNAAVVRGELPLVPTSHLASFWRLHTIFRETRYRDETL